MWVWCGRRGCGVTSGDDGRGVEGEDEREKARDSEQLLSIIYAPSHTDNGLGVGRREEGRKKASWQALCQPVTPSSFRPNAADQWSLGQRRKALVKRETDGSASLLPQPAMKTRHIGACQPDTHIFCALRVSRWRVSQRTRVEIVTVKGRWAGLNR